MIIRAATAADSVAIDAVQRLAFPTEHEALLVAALVADGDALVSLVADDAGDIAGHLMFSGMQVSADGAPIVAAGLGPVAVRPPRQGAGIGSGLILAGLEALATLAVSIAFVLGDPCFYRRFGFDAAVAARFASPYAGPYLMARWIGSLRVVASGSAAYAPAFARQGAPA